MRTKNLIFPLMVLTLWSGFWACKGNGDDPLEYNRETLLRNSVNNYILPAYNDLAARTSALHDGALAFSAAPDGPALDSLQAALKTAWLAWESCSPLGFGPAANLNLRPALNTFPSDPLQIEANVASGTWDLTSATNVDARGFPALDYLLHHSDDATLLSEFTSGPDTTRRRNLLLALTADIRDLTGQVNDQWSAGGSNYAATFLASLGTDAGSSTAALVNQLNYDLEQLKNARLGIPLGKKSLGQTLPDKVECYYGGYSAQLARQQFKAIRALYEGTAFGSSAQGYGLYAALVALDVPYNGGLLADAISGQAVTAQQALANVPDPLDQAIVINDVVAANAAWDEVQKLIVLLKTDMPSAMSILITYTDNDGD
jgi:predicted lipoprotein